ncbi:hypothetical protein TYRP_014525 [Tyrophagus putrescentiae]|nr:hypothetical protein TYRP_014525 [Tyrophagus putrescentiae]
MARTTLTVGGGGEGGGGGGCEEEEEGDEDATRSRRLAFVRASAGGGCGPSSKRLKKSELLGDLQRSSGNGTASPDENSGEDE